MTSGLRIGRRAFLRYAGLSAGLLAVSRLRLPVNADAALGVTREGEALRVLSATDARVLAAIGERMVFTDDPGMPRFGATHALRTIDTALLQLPEETRGQLHWAIRIFEYAPPFFVYRLSAFTGLEEAVQDAYLQAWSTSRFETCRLAFRALKNLSMLGYYAQDSTWGGIHYQGPWVPRPRRYISAE
jgi:hypothetical protein